MGSYRAGRARKPVGRGFIFPALFPWVALLVLSRGTDLETAARPQSLPSMCKKGESSLASVIVPGVLGASWLPGEPRTGCCQGQGPSRSRKVQVTTRQQPNYEAVVTALSESRGSGSLPGGTRNVTFSHFPGSSSSLISSVLSV